MQPHAAKLLLGFPPHSHPPLSQIKAAYRRKALECHPDRFQDQEKAYAESNFKLISEAYTCLQAGSKQQLLAQAKYARVVNSGVPKACGERSNHLLVKLPFLLLVFGTVSLGCLCAARAYKRQKEASPSNHPFLP